MEDVRDLSPTEQAALGIHSDPDNVLHLKFDDQGRVAEMGLESNWRDALTPEALPVVVTALLASRPLPYLAAQATSRRLHDSSLPVRVAADVQEQLAALQHGLLTQVPAMVAAIESGGENVRSRNGKISMRVAAGRVVSVAADADWLGSAVRAGIVHGFMDAFERAHERLDDPEAGLSDPVSSYFEQLAEIGRLLDDYERG